MDIERADDLLFYLRETDRLAQGEHVKITVLEGGVSNRTVLLERANGDDWVLKQALKKLRVSVDWFSNPERIHREAAGMRYLSRFAPESATVPLIFEDEDEHVLAMQAVPKPHENWKTMLLRGELKSEHVKQFATLLGSIHREAYLANERSGEVAEAFKDRSYFENLRLEPYYLYTAQQVPEAAAFLRQLVKDTRSRLFTLVHGDYSPKNVLVYRGQLVLLDHEVIHFGDGAFDLGFALTHLLSKAHHLKAHRAAFAEAALQFWHEYEHISALPFSTSVETYAVRHTLGCLLARVAGRSPLEYLSESEKQLQKELVIHLMKQPPATIKALITEFIKGVNHVRH